MGYMYRVSTASVEYVIYFLIDLIIIRGSRNPIAIKPPPLNTDDIEVEEKFRTPY